MANAPRAFVLHMRKPLALLSLGLLILAPLATGACGSAEPAPVAQPAVLASASAEPSTLAPVPAVSATVAPSASAVVVEAPPPPAPIVLGVDKTLALGRWPEGIAISQGDVFVAESGDRKVARIELATGKVKVRITVGRLPVDLDAAPDGTVYVVPQTDKTLIAINPANNLSRLVARLPDQPESMRFGNGALYLLLWENDTSAQSSVVRVDPTSGKLSRSGQLGSGSRGIAIDAEHVWVGQDARISVLEQRALGKQPEVSQDGHHFVVAAGAGAMFSDDTSTVVRVDAATRTVTRSADLHEPIAALAVSGNDVLVASRGGRVWRLDAATLAVKAELVPETAFEPRAITAIGDTILVTTHGSRDAKPDHGSLIVIRPR